MIDIHCHILPNVDDGAKDMEMALEMAKAAVDEGIDTIIASPHHRNGQFENSKSSILESVDQLNNRLKEARIPLTILPGQETRIFGEMVDSYLDDELLSLNHLHQYLLVELSSSHVPRYIHRLFFDLQQQGVTPIIVHPERNAEIIENPEILYRLVKEGALTQVTAGSVTGHFGKKIQKFSIDLITHNLTHFVATDAHNLTSRPINLRKAYEFIEDECSAFYRYMFLENAEMIVAGRMPLVEPPEMIKRKKFLGIF
ncbi:tyrosine protein phosphatase [Anaerobacillus alkalilacustris]|uniref:Tyrosine-protein phosphatase n=1 Tax=Anaerobacillus alkalilacustris TaxID=393763 RepID=A0A1S2LFW3_9BACI|nr:CpsB/CapC family capsule biosynthesis tyrosine phosphatase [Anaerobacillus alkalilacustris]OIJ11256.1 tyrosine protein phosphatase [Anaerobacillus alkalilacustris]